MRSISFENEEIVYDAQGEGNYYDTSPFRDVVFQQYTGLKDSKGVDIYEGDRVRFAYTENQDFFGEVKWLDDRASFGVESGNAFVTFEDLIDYMHFFEVIGNIFENQKHCT